MQLDKENIRKLRGLIIFTLIILVGLLRFDVVLDGIGFILHILSPFISGGAIAFVLSVPMNRSRPTRIISVKTISPLNLRIFSLSNCKRSSPLNHFYRLLLKSIPKRYFLRKNRRKGLQIIYILQAFFGEYSLQESPLGLN